MEDTMTFAIEINERSWKQLVATVKDLTLEEAEWRPVPESNNINLIIRHLVIEAQWQLDAMQTGKPMPAEVDAEDQKLIDSIPLDDFDENYKKLEKSCTAFIEALRQTTFGGLGEKGQTAYQEYRAAGVTPALHFLGFHHAMHLTGHAAQISTLRNLFRRTRGEPGLMFPDNPTFPK
jgi:hypothetical protein